MVNPMRGSLHMVAVYLRHYRACLAVFWVLTLVLATFALGGFPQSTPRSITPTGIRVHSREAVCTDGRILVHFVTSGATECILIVPAHT